MQHLLAPSLALALLFTLCAAAAVPEFHGSARCGLLLIGGLQGTQGFQIEGLFVPHSNLVQGTTWWSMAAA